MWKIVDKDNRIIQYVIGGEPEKVLQDFNEIYWFKNRNLKLIETTPEAEGWNTEIVNKNIERMLRGEL